MLVLFLNVIFFLLYLFFFWGVMSCFSDTIIVGKSVWVCFDEHQRCVIVYTTFFFPLKDLRVDISSQDSFLWEICLRQLISQFSCFVIFKNLAFRFVFMLYFFYRKVICACRGWEQEIKKQFSVHCQQGQLFYLLPSQDFGSGS